MLVIWVIVRDADFRDLQPAVQFGSIELGDDIVFVGVVFEVHPVRRRDQVPVILFDTLKECIDHRFTSAGGVRVAVDVDVLIGREGADTRGAFGLDPELHRVGHIAGRLLGIVDIAALNRQQYDDEDAGIFGAHGYVDYSRAGTEWMI